LRLPIWSGGVFPGQVARHPLSCLSPFVTLLALWSFPHSCWCLDYLSSFPSSPSLSLTGRLLDHPTGFSFDDLVKPLSFFRRARAASPSTLEKRLPLSFYWTFFFTLLPIFFTSCSESPFQYGPHSFLMSGSVRSWEGGCSFVAPERYFPTV